MKTLDLQGKIFVLFLVGGVIFLCLLLTYRALTGHATYDLYPFYRIRVTEAQPCLGLDGVGQPVNVIEPFRTGSERLQVCARLEVEYIGLKGYDVPLHFLWCYEGEPEYLSESHMYSPGYITASLKPKPGGRLQPGVYQVEIRNGRSMYASTEILVAPER